MGFSALQIILVFVWVFIVAIDQFDFLESLYQPIVSGAVIGAILGDLPTGLIVGGTYQLMTIGNMPVGGAQPPNAVIGGVMAAVFAISSHLDTTAAVGLAVPFALIGQYMVTFLFTLMSPMMSKADQLAAKGDTKGIVRLNYMAMALLGLLFAVVCTLGMLGGSAMGTTLSNLHLLCWFCSGNHHRLHPRTVRLCSAADRICGHCNCSVRLPDSRCYQAGCWFWFCCEWRRRRRWHLMQLITTI